MSGILFSAYQKFYSALNCLKNFDKENDFFENISNLDNFFSEFRNVTFVLQKSIAHTEYVDVYVKNRNKYLMNSKWFIDKRNEVTKQQPFPLVKCIDIYIYYPYCGIKVLSKRFTVEDDVSLSSLIDSVKEFLSKDNSKEVFFSAKFSYFENGKKEELYDKLMIGIKSMIEFLNVMKSDINEECNLCDELNVKINEIYSMLSIKEMLFIIDYIYYPQRNEFECGDRISPVFVTQKYTNKVSLKVLSEFEYFEYNKDYFLYFITMNILIGSINVLPTIWTIYEDDTFTFDLFNSSIKTTLYRKINEIADNILSTNIKEIYFMLPYTLYDSNEIIREMTSIERIVYGKEDYLVFMKVDKFLNEEEYSFEASNLKDKEYISYQLKYGKKTKLSFGRLNLKPIVEAFRKKN